MGVAQSGQSGGLQTRDSAGSNPVTHAPKTSYGTISNMAYSDPLDPRAREARLKHYRANKSQYLERNLLKKQELREIANAAKNVPCTDCGVRYPSYVMQFDHIDPSTKTANIGRLINGGSKAKLLAEIEKCEVVCANCHAERTHGELKRNGK